MNQELTNMDSHSSMRIFTSQDGVGRESLPLRLMNEKNSCFANAGLSMLYSIQEVREIFQSDLWKAGSRPQEQPLSAEVARLFQNAGNLDSACHVRTLVSQYIGDQRFSRGTQEDSTEWLETLVNLLNMELPHNLELDQKFRGEMAIQRKFVNRVGTCGSCGQFPEVRTQAYQFIKLDVPLSDTPIQLSCLLENYLSESTKEETMRCSYCCIHGESVCPMTGFCKPKRVTSQIELTETPKFLKVLVNRFSSTGGEKLTTSVTPPDNLKIKEENFKLCSVIEHIGSSPTSGHYIAHIKLGDWIECNDSNITFHDTDKRAKNRNAYCFLYSKLEDNALNENSQVQSVARKSGTLNLDIEILQSEEGSSKKNSYSIVEPGNTTQDDSMMPTVDIEKNIREPDLLISTSDESLQQSTFDDVNETVTMTSGFLDGNITQTEDKSMPHSEDKFKYICGNAIFEEVDDKQIKCVCGNTYVQISNHLKKNKNCSDGLSLKDFQIALNKFRQRKRHSKSANILKKKNPNIF